MTSPFPTFLPEQVLHYRRLISQNVARDNLHHLIHEVRDGNIRQMYPSELSWSVDFHGSPVANFIDTVARDMAEGLAPLPSLKCVSGRMQSEADKQRAERKNLIGEYFWRKSKLLITMPTGTDQFVTYGFLPGMVEPCADEKRPHIRLIDPRNSYYELDRWGNTNVFAKVYRKTVDTLCAEFPEWANLIRQDPQFPQRQVDGNSLLDMVQWVDRTSVTLFLPERKGLQLGSYDHKMSRCPVKIARRPGDSDNPRGQFDDAVWVQVARSILSTLALEAASLAVQAPIALPDDVTELNVGPHAVLQSKDANQIKRVGIDLPATTFAEAQNLDNELRVGTRYPDARSGNPGTSVVTGKGVEALLGSFDSQIKGYQLIFKDFLEDLTSMCFEMDEKWWPGDSKVVNGTTAGTSYEFTYTPAKDIAGRWDCTVTYGFAAGLQPEQATIWMLQLEGAGMLAKGTVMENLPYGIDTVQEQKAIHIERAREALEQGVFALVGQSGVMAAQGQDPMPVINMAVEMVRALQDGRPVEESIAQAYQDMVQQQQQAQQEQMQAMAAAQGGGDQGQGGGGGGLADLLSQAQQNTPPGQAGEPAGGRPSIESLAAGFRGNGTVPVMQAQIRRTNPVGTA